MNNAVRVVDWSATGAMLAGVGSVATAAVAVAALLVAWYQVSEARRSAREVFARQAWQQMLSISISHPELTSRQIDLDNATSRKSYVDYLSLLFSTAEDVLRFVHGGTSHAVHLLSRDITAHLLFVQARGLDEWNFYRTPRLLQIVREACEESRKSLESDLRNAAREGDQLRAKMNLAHLHVWSQRVDEAVRVGEAELNSAFIEWDSNSAAVSACDEKFSVSMKSFDDEFENLTMEEKSLVFGYSANRKTASIESVAANNFANLITRIDEEIGDEGEADAQG